MVKYFSCDNEDSTVDTIYVIACEIRDKLRKGQSRFRHVNLRKKNKSLLITMLSTIYRSGYEKYLVSTRSNRQDLLISEVWSLRLFCDYFVWIFPQQTVKSLVY